MVRADALRNEDKIREAAAAAFREHGLLMSLEDVAARAQVSKGTIYHRFGGRAGLIDAVLDEVGAAEIGNALDQAEADGDPWDRLAAYLTRIWQLEYDQPAMCDVLSRAYPKSERLNALCDRAVKTCAALVKDAKRTGALREEVTADDIYYLIWSAALVLRHGPRQPREDFERRCRLQLAGLTTADVTLEPPDLSTNGR